MLEVVVELGTGILEEMLDPEQGDVVGRKVIDQLTSQLTDCSGAANCDQK